MMQVPPKTNEDAKKTTISENALIENPIGHTLYRSGLIAGMVK